MLQIFKKDESIKELKALEEGCWVALTAPTYEELNKISEATNIDIDDLRAPLDDEERSRIEHENDYVIIVVDIPSLDEKDRYVTIPLGIYITKTMIVTVCLEETPILTAFMNDRVKEFYTYKKTRFVFQILYRNATSYLRYLRIINRKSDQIEDELHKSQKNKELIELLELEKSLVYFTTSLRSNETVLEKLLRTDKVKKYPEDEELLEDVIVENKQAIEMANIYSGILSGMMDAFASVISNNLNVVMKFLSTVTIVLSIPTMIASFYGMNFDNIPLGHNPFGFVIVVVVALFIALGVSLVFWRKNLF
ncbi:magnesium transporter CorA family protein [Eubacterium xylanophilum]|uniref:magnesium transporter CorA family protein n=1 Tax=Eubacterium xylanophilum TaxID=39497 RepID=UPI00047941D9|nr:magnesium transporter CorA family protein [Eubacterium xylanophilum]